LFARFSERPWDWCRRSIRLGLVVLGLAALAACSSGGTRPDSGLERVAENRDDALAEVDLPELSTATEVDAGLENDSDSTGEVTDPEITEPERLSRRERRQARRAERERNDAVARSESADAGDVSAVEAEIVVPENVLIAYERALAAMQLEDWPEAELELEQLILEFPDYPGPYVNLAIVYARDGRIDEARDALDNALAIDPGHAAANNQLGMLLREQGEFEAAESAYRTAIESDPGYALAHYNLGVLLDLYMRREAEALESYEAYQVLLPEPDAEVGRWIVDLRRRLGLSTRPERVAQQSGTAEENSR
jgi:tetratricopeptide (TPR) repeat protein